MKKLLSLLLAMLLCLGVLVACDNTDEHSDFSSKVTSNEEQNSSDENGNDESSLIEELKNNTIEKIPYEVDYDELDYPVFRSQISKKYEYYNVSMKESLWAYQEKFDRWFFDDFASFKAFMEKYSYLSQLNENVNGETFQDNFVMVICKGDRRHYDNCSYGDFAFVENSLGNILNKDYYRIVFEYTKLPKVLSENVLPPTFDIVIIPREDCDTDPTQVEIYVKTIVHSYDLKSELIK